MIDMPERINVIRTMTYDVTAIVAGMKELGWTDEEITEDIIYQYIEDCVDEDFLSPPSRHDMVWQDENGEEL